MIIPKFSFELPEMGITLDDTWNLGYSGISSKLLVIVKNGEMRKTEVLNVVGDNGEPVYDLNSYPLRATGGPKGLVTVWYQDIVLDKGSQADVLLSKKDIVRVFESSEKT